MDAWRYMLLSAACAILAEGAKWMGISRYGARDFWKLKSAVEGVAALLPEEWRTWLSDAGWRFLQSVADKVSHLTSYLMDNLYRYLRS